MTNLENEIINQAKSDARTESLKNLLIQNQKLIKITIAALIVIAIGLFAVNAYKKANRVKFSKILHQVLLDQRLGNEDKAIEGLKLIYESKSAPSDLRSLAALRFSAMLIDDNKIKEAVEIYLDIANCSSCDRYIANLSALIAVKIMISDDNWQNDNNLVKKITKIENSATILRYYITEQRGFLQLKLNNLKESYQAFELIIQNPESSPNLKERAQEAVKLIMSKGFDPSSLIEK